MRRKQYRLSKNQPQPITDLYLNGRLQFSSIDEQIYHSMLVYPAMLASNRHDRVLINPLKLLYVTSKKAQ